MDHEARILSDLLKIATGLCPPREGRLLDTSCCDWQKIRGYAEAQHVLPLVYSSLKHVSVQPPADICEYLYNSYRASQLLCARAWHEFLRINDVFQTQEIPLVPLKGIAFLDDIYPKLSARDMCDMDLLVKPEDFSRAEEALNDLGYCKELGGLSERYWREKHFHMVFVRKCSGGPSFFVELHWLLDFPVRERGSGLNLWNRTRILPAYSRDVVALSPEDSIMCLALHQRRFGNTLGMKNVLDAALLLKKYSSMDWHYIGNEARLKKARAAVYFILLQAKILFGQNIPAQAERVLGVSFVRRFVMKRIIFTRTFAPFSFQRLKRTCVDLQFLLCDSLTGAFLFFFNISQEQFAQYYNLPVYAPKTEHYYRFRWWYMLIGKLGAG